MRIKNHVALCFDNKTIANRVCEIVEPKYRVKRGDPFYTMDIFTDSKEYQELTEFLKENPPDFRNDTPTEVYTDGELCAAPLLRMIPNAHRGGYPQPDNGTIDTNYFSVSFDRSNACPYCTKGMIQARPLRLSGSVKLGKQSDISGIWWLRDYVISGRLKDLILEEGLTGCEIWPVIIHGANKPFDDLFQLKFTGELPAMAPETNIILDPTRNHSKACAPATLLEGPVIYRKADLTNIPDFALSKEWFGGNGEYWRWPFMSQRAYQLFKRNKIKGIRWSLPEIIY